MKKIWIILCVCILVCLGILLWREVLKMQPALSLDENALPKVANGALPFRIATL